MLICVSPLGSDMEVNIFNVSVMPYIKLYIAMVSALSITLMTSRAFGCLMLRTNLSNS